MTHEAIGAAYTRDPACGVWRRSGSRDIAYSDGAAVEGRLLELVNGATDLRVLSAELPLRVTDWTSEYHLSAARSNLIRPLGIRPGDAVLELGGGCGAITRALGETGATVLAVEGTLARARVAASRCRDLPNVAVAHDTISEFSSPAKFDVVTLIGVLEYAPLYFGGENPVQECLAIAASHLRQGGRLIVAIENQLGLKYLAGCAEDHVGRRYFGVHDLYHSATPVTFGRKQLHRRLQAAGLQIVETLYPFPDYKLPSVVLHDDAIGDEQLNVGDVLARAQSRDRRNDRLRAFDESLAWQVVGRNGLAGELANSFLVIASSAPPPLQQGRWLVKSYAVMRRPQYATETTLRRDGADIVVSKHRLQPGEPESPVVRHVLSTAPYVPGQMFITDLYRLTVDDFDLKRVAQWAAPWVQFVRAEAAAGSGDPLDALLPGRYLDCTPFNIIRQAQGLAYIDAEWEWHASVPLHWVLLRGLAYSANRWLLTDKHPGLTYRTFATAVLGHVGLVITDRHFAAAAALEDALMAALYLDEPPASFDRLLDSTLPRYDDAMQQAQCAIAAQQALGVAEAEVKRVKNSLSWVLTKPLRLAENLVSGRLLRKRTGQGNR